MKLLLDQNLSYRLVARLADLFPGSQQVRRIGLDRVNDAAIWQHAAKNGFVLVTQDADFADLASVLGTPPKVVWLRCGNRPTDAIEGLLRRYASEIQALASSDDVDCLEFV